MFRGPAHGSRWTALTALAALLAACGGGGSGGPPAPAVQARFAVDQTHGSAPLLVTFQDLSGGPVTSWSWEFGDGSSSSEREPQHEYAAEGRYGVRLTVRAGPSTSTLELPDLVLVERPTGDAIAYGMNPSFARWSSREIVFADAMMRASEFLVVRAGELTLEPAPIVPLGRGRTGEGWPDFAPLAAGESAGAWLFGPLEGTLPDGRSEPWILTWEGTGNCQLFGTAVLGELRRSTRRAEVRVDPAAGNGNGTVALWIESSSRVDPVRNVHVWLPGTSLDHPLFWAPYVERVRALNLGRGPYTWRTLDWTCVNEYGSLDPPVPFTFDLAGVIRPASPSQGTRRGMCPEFQAAFCNLVGAGLHFQVPHRTDQLGDAEYEAFLRDAFTRLRDGSPAVPGINGGQAFAGLDAGLPLTLELSNELWNGLFPASRWMQREAARRGTTVHAVIAGELQRAWRIADEVFAGRRTVRRFVGGWVAEADFVGRVLAALPPGTRVDALGPSCYFRPLPDAIARWLAGASAGSCPNCPTPEEVIAASYAAFPVLRDGLRAHRAVAEAYTNPDGSHPRLELYECGQSFDAQGAPWGEAARTAQTLPGMYSAYVDALVPLLVDEGVEVVDWYSFMTDQDPSHGVDVGFGIWNDMGQTLTLPVPEPYLDEGAPKAAAIYRGPPPR